MTFLALFATILGATWLLMLVIELIAKGRVTWRSVFDSIVATTLLAAGLVGLGVAR